MSEPTIICVFRFISARTESNMLQNCSCCLSLQGKYTYISAIEMYLPLMHLPQLSKEVNLSLRQIILPENSSSGSVVIGESDPAARHAWYKVGERMMATPLKRCCQPFSPRSALCQKIW